MKRAARLAAAAAVLGLGLGAAWRLAAPAGPADPAGPGAACSSCDARHQGLAGKRVERALLPPED